MTATPPSWRPDLREPADLVEEVLRLEGLESIPSVLPQAPAGRGPHRGAETPPRGRKVVGAQRLCRDPADTVPARRSVRPVGAAAGRPAPHRRRRCSIRWSPTARVGHHAAAWAAGSPWPATFPAVPSTRRCSPSSRWSSRHRKPAPSNYSERPQAHRRARSRRSTRRCPNQPQHVGVVLAGLREPAGPWGPGRRACTPPTPSRRSASSRARAASS